MRVQLNYSQDNGNIIIMMLERHGWEDADANLV